MVINGNKWDPVMECRGDNSALNIKIYVLVEAF
jgi:hypothetical protein